MGRGGVEAELLGSRNGEELESRAELLWPARLELLIEKCGLLGQKPVLMMQVGVNGIAVASKASSASANRASLM